MTISPIDAQVLGGALQSIALEMGRRLARMSYSSIIRESEDFGAALLDAQGRQLAESTDSTPLQLGPIPGYLRGILRCLEERGEVIEEGDVLMHNSPYHGSSTASSSATPSRPPTTSTSAPCTRAPAASSTRSTRTPRACSSRPSRSTRRAGA